MKKILFIGSIPPPYNGSNFYFESLINSKIKDVFSVTVLNISDGRTDIENIGRIDFQNIFTAVKNSIELTIKLIWIQPDLVYLCPSQGLAYFRDSIFILLTKILSRAKIVEHLHGADFLSFYSNANKCFKIIIDYTQKRVNSVIVLGEKLKFIFNKWIKYSDIYCVPNGIDYFLDKSDKLENITSLLFLGNIMKFRGIEEILVAIVEIKKKYNNIQIKIAGGWGFDNYYQLSSREFKKRIKSIISENNLEDNIEFLGPIYNEAKDKIFQKAKIFIYPSEQEGMPLVILEAMASSCAIITTRNVGVIDEVIVNGYNGILIDKKSPDQIADAVISLIESGELFNRITINAKSDYLLKYTKSVNIDNIINVFNNVLTGILCAALLG